MTRTYQTEFPSFDPATMPDAPASWVDTSWHNDACPSYEVAVTPICGARVVVWIDHEDEAKRDYPDGERFTLQLQVGGPGGQLDLLQSDDWGAIIRAATVQGVAATFAAMLSEELDADEWRAMRRKNAGEAFPVCYSHDYVDSNETMAAAILKVTGTPAIPDLADGMPPETLTLWNDAWAAARFHYIRAPADSDGAAFDQWRTTGRDTASLMDAVCVDGPGRLYEPGFVETGAFGPSGDPFMVNVANISATFPTLEGAERALWDWHSADEWRAARELDQPFTVVFYIDGDHAVETFVQHVRAPDRNAAWQAAVDAARDDGGSSSGHSLDDSEWENATEIATFAGHLDG